jgi:hypothetical protein
MVERLQQGLMLPPLPLPPVERRAAFPVQPEPAQRSTPERVREQPPQHLEQASQQVRALSLPDMRLPRFADILPPQFAVPSYDFLAMRQESAAVKAEENKPSVSPSSIASAHYNRAQAATEAPMFDLVG